jgi:LacI family transcriptional regulator
MESGSELPRRADTAGGQRRGMREVAVAAGVSVSTVANVLNNPGVVAPGTRQRVEDAMSRVGFVRSGPARQLRGMPSRLVGSVTLDQANPFYAALNRGIEDRLDESGCMLVACSTDVQPDRERRMLEVLEEQSPRGIVITPTGANQDLTAAVHGRGTPIVIVDGHQDGLDLCTVNLDHVLGGSLAGRHFVELGHRRTAFLSALPDVAPVMARQAGLERVLAAAGLPPPLHVQIRAGELFEAADAAVSDLTAGPHERPTALLCFNDITAVAVIQALHRRGIRVPEDMSVVGYDDLPFVAQMQPPLTTVGRPVRDLGRVAASLLLDEGRPDHRHRQIVYEPSLVVRSSTAPPCDP